ALDRLIHQAALGLHPASPSRQIPFQIRYYGPIGTGHEPDHVIGRTAFARDDTGSVIHILLHANSRLAISRSARTSDATRALYQSKSPTTTRQSVTRSHKRTKDALNH